MVVVLLLVATGGVVVWLHHGAQKVVAPTAPKTINTAPKTPVETKPQFSLDDPASIWVVVNKQHPLPSTYVPSDLVAVGSQQMRRDAAAAVQKLIDAATVQSVALRAVSGYRSYVSQTSVYNNYVKTDGVAKADTYSARPGHSEHQTGLAVDLGASNGSCDLQICFADTAEGKWLAAHAYEYGLTIRYPADKTTVTGYQYEPWHLRYVGTDLAKKLHDSGKTIEEYFDLPAAPSY